MSELEAFSGAGDKLGVSIWRIENFKPVPQPTSDTGRFATGDSYIVLNVFERHNAKKFNLHFWLGNETTKDESGTAAFLSAALDELLGGKPIQYRELQGHESPEFLQLFKNGVQYTAGGIASGFTKAETKKPETRLLHIRGARGVRVAEVPLKVDSLNHGDVFVLDDGYEIFQWNGNGASAVEKAKALNITMAIKNDERSGKAMVHVINDEDVESEHAKHFFLLLGVKNPSSVAIADSVSKSVASLFEPAKLYKVDGTSFSEVTGVAGGLQKSNLETDCLFVLHGSGKVFVWIGEKAESDIKKKVMETAVTFLEQKGLSSDKNVQIVKEKMEPPIFKDNFQHWEVEEIKTKLRAANTKEERAQIDVKTLVQGSTAQAAKAITIDDGSGTVKVWRVEDFKLVDWPEDKYGHFYAGDSYVIKYTYVKSGRDQVLLYFWQGRDSSTDEKGASAVLAQELDEQMGGTPTQIRLLQNKEPDHFFQIFHGGVIIHLGGLNNEDEAKEGPNKERLYQIKGYNEYDTHANQVRTAASNLNSGDSFIVVDGENVIVWHGKLCSDEERSFGMTISAKLAEGKPVIVVEEGEEDDDFWTKLGGKEDYPNIGDLPPFEQPARLFHISDSATGGHGIAVEEIYDFDQEDLCDEDVMLLDTYSEIYIWVGQSSRENEKKEAMELARKYLAEMHAVNDRDEETSIAVVHSGKEPPTFTCHFLGWDDTKAAAFEDPYTAKLKALQSAEKPDSDLKKLAAERRKNFVDPDAAKKSQAKPSTPTQPPTPTVQSETPPSTNTEEFKFKPLVDFFPLEELKGMKSNSGIDVRRKEDYVSDSEFEQVFGMSRSEFATLPAWKKKQKKQQLGIF